jgi:iron complex outermembrane receptor protein
VDREILGAQLRIDSKIGEFGFVSITDFQTADKFYTEGGDSSPDAGVYFFQGSDLDQVSQEFRFTRSFERHEFVGGVFGMKVDGSYIGKFADPFYGYDPDVSFTQKTTSYAAFVQDEWQFAERWKLIGGLRYWKDTREGTYRGDETSLTGVTIIFNQQQVFPVFPGSPVTPATAKRSFDDITARLQLDFKINDDTLLYASYNRGSKSGGYTFSTGTPFAGFEQAFLEGIPFDPEVLSAFEVGVKSSVGERTTLNASVFHYDYKDYQAFAQVGPVQSVINLDAKASGLEVEFNTRPITGLTLQLGASFLDTKVQNILLPDLVSVVEHDLPQAPGFSGNALVRYEFPMASGRASVQFDAQFSQEFCFTVLCAPVEKEEGYSVANLRIGFGADDDRWEVAAYVNNLFEEKYRVYAFDSSLFAGVVAGVYAKPRTFALTATYRFGAY